MEKKLILFLGIICLLFSYNAPSAHSFGFGKKSSSSSDGGYTKVGGYMQMGYKEVSGDSESESLVLRSLRPHIMGKAHSGWHYKLEWEMGDESNYDLVVKDAYIKYTLFKGFNLFIGNDVFPFSRAQLTPANERLLIDRTFAGDTNYGTPGHQFGFHLKGHSKDWKLLWRASVAKATTDGNHNKGIVIIENPIENKTDKPGLIYGGRVDYYPKGRINFTQSTFNKKRSKNFGFGAGWYTWDAEEGNGDTYESVTGLELSGVYRGSGVSVDAQYNTIDTDRGGNNGSNALTTMAVQAGYIIKPWRMEVVGGFEKHATDADEDIEWSRKTIGFCYYFKAHDVKFQASYRMSENDDFVDERELKDMYVHLQVAF